MESLAKPAEKKMWPDVLSEMAGVSGHCWHDEDSQASHQYIRAMNAT